MACPLVLAFSMSSLFVPVLGRCLVALIYHRGTSLCFSPPGIHYASMTSLNMIFLQLCATLSRKLSGIYCRMQFNLADQSKYFLNGTQDSFFVLFFKPPITCFGPIFLLPHCLFNRSHHTHTDAVIYFLSRCSVSP